MSRPALGAIAILLLLALLLAISSVFIVDVRHQAIVLRFGEYVRTVQDPGLHLKRPWFFETVYDFDSRVLDVEPPSEEVIAADQKRLVVDSYARWRITDPLRFFQSATDEAGARSRLNSIISASLRRVLGNVSLGSVLSDERARIMRQITDEVREQAKPFGIAVLDVRLRRTDLPEANNQAIYARMQSERQREAQEFRAQGDELAQRIRSVAERERTVIRADAQRQSEILRGEGEAESVRIYADAFGKDKDFFAFYRSMQAYKESLSGSGTTLLLTPDSEFFRYFEHPDGRATAGTKP